VHARARCRRPPAGSRQSEQNHGYENEWEEALNDQENECTQDHPPRERRAGLVGGALLARLGQEDHVAVERGAGALQHQHQHQAGDEVVLVVDRAAAVDVAAVELEQTNLREGLPPLAPAVVANLTAPVLLTVAAQLTGASGGRGRAPRSLPAVAPGSPPPAPDTLVCSGLLPSELDEVTGAFAPAGLTEADRRHDGDWSALLLRRR